MSDHGHDDHGGTGKYFAIAGMLCVLTTASFLTYFPFWKSTFGEDSWVAWIFMMAVAVTKASLVMMFFMHLKWEAAWKYVLTIPSIIMAIFLMLALVPDVGLRLTRQTEEREAHSSKVKKVNDFGLDEEGAHH